MKSGKEIHDSIITFTTNIVTLNIEKRDEKREMNLFYVGSSVGVHSLVSILRLYCTLLVLLLKRWWCVYLPFPEFNF